MTKAPAGAFFIVAKECQLPMKTSKRNRLWLFDLDNTLHDASRAIYPEINRNMNDFMSRTLRAQGQDLDVDKVSELRRYYWQKYGATLIGMMRHHQVRADDFLQAAHTFTDLLSMIHAERGLRHVLKKLPGKKILLTNAPYAYSREVLRHIGLYRLFHGHIAVEHMYVHGRLSPKPSRRMLRQVLARQRCRPSDAVLVEDTAMNLKAARQVGLRTVLVTRYLASNPLSQMADKRRQMTKKPAFVDVRVHSTRQLQRRRLTKS